MAASVVALIVLLRAGSIPEPEQTTDSTAPASFTDVRRVIDRRCAACHSMTPSDASLGVAPGGVAFDTPDQISAHAARIRERAVVTRTMPPANKTNMTEAERALLGRWIAQGAGVR
jgi:uncharacterized membrane protein